MIVGFVLISTAILLIYLQVKNKIFYWKYANSCNGKPKQGKDKADGNTAENDMTVDVIDALGKIVKTTKIIQGSTLSIIETDNLYNGTYIVRISDGSKSKTTKVIIAK